MKRFVPSVVLCVAMGLVLPLVGGTPGSAWAKPGVSATKEAKERYGRGVELFKEGDYQAALVEFRRAHELAPNYAVLYNIGQVYYQLHDYANALTTLERYVAEGGRKIKPKRRRSVEADIAKLRPRVAHIAVEVSAAGAEVLVDDVPVGHSPLDEPLTVSAGRRKVTVIAPGRDPVTKHVDVAGSETATVEFRVGPGSGDPRDLSDDDDDTDDAGEASDGDSYWWVGWVVTGTLATGALITGLLSLDASATLEEVRASRTSREELDDFADQTFGLAVATDVLIGGAAVAGGLSLVFMLLDVTASDEEPAADEAGGVRVRWSAGPTGFSVHGEF